MHAHAARRSLQVESLEDRRLLAVLPTAVDDAYAVGESGFLSVGAPGVLDNDYDGDDDTLSVDVDALDDEGMVGVVAMLADGSFVYNPSGKFNDLAGGETALDTFRYTITDGNDGTATATVTITIEGNDPPTGVDDSYTVDEGALLEVASPGVLDNDVDDPGDTLQVTSADVDEVVGTVSWNSDGSFTYNQDGKLSGMAAGETETVTFTYTLSDGEGGSAAATVTITVEGVNEPPIAVADEYETDEDSPLSVSAAEGLLANDSDADFSDALRVSGIDAEGVLGNLSVNEDGSFTYDPAGEFESLAVSETATVTFSYTVSDSQDATATETVTLTIEGVNDVPTAVAKDYAADEDHLLSVPLESGLLLGAEDVDTSDELIVSEVNLAGTEGTVSVEEDGSFTYDPRGKFDELQAGDSATDSFRYTVDDGNGGTASATVTITIEGLPNDAPTAVPDDYSVYEQEIFVVDATLGVLANDTDPNPLDVLSVAAVDRAGMKGLVAVSDEGGIAYRYDPSGKYPDIPVGETVTDTFRYTVSDGEGGTDTATVTITVRGNSLPNAVDDAYAVDEDELLQVTTGGLLDNDTDAEDDPLEVTDVDVTDTTGTVTCSGDGTFTYEQNGKFDYVAVGETATDTFRYTIDDGKGGTDTATVTITINGVNDAPLAEDDAYEVDEDTQEFYAPPGLLHNDSDPDGDDLEVVVGGADGSQGLILVFKNGSFIYDPQGIFDYLAVGETATDSFTYPVTDGQGGTDTATATITVHGVNDAPVANDDTGSTDEDSLLEVPAAAGLLANDTDLDTNDMRTVVDVDTTGTQGTVEVHADGSYSYDPRGVFDLLQAGDSATDSFRYTMNDKQGATSTATVTITINGLPNATPQADDDSYEVDKASTLIVNLPGLLGNDEDSDTGDTLAVQSVDLTGVKGLVAWKPDGSFVYNPDGEFDELLFGESDVDTFSYLVSDGEGGTDTATVSITVQGNNDPVARQDAYEIHKDAVLQITAPGLLANDIDPDDALFVTAIDTNLTVGEIVDWDTNGSFTYDPGGWFDGLGIGESATDVFSYTIDDGKGNTDTANVTITITGDAIQVSEVVVNDGAAQRSMLTSVSVVFNADVTIAADAFELKNHDTGEIVSTEFTTDINDDGNTVATLTFLSGSSVYERGGAYALVDGNYKLTVKSSKVTRGNGQLDGDGAGGDYVFGDEAVDKFYRLFGDAVQQNRVVNLLDFGGFRSTYGKAAEDDGYRDEFDYDGNGVVNLMDFGKFRGRYGKQLDFD